MALAGDLAEVSSSDLLSLLTQRGVTGALVMRHDDDDATLVFASGRLVAVTSDAASRFLERWLSEPGRLAEDQFAQLLADPVDGALPLPLAARLRSDRLVAVEGLAELMTSQAETVLARVLGWLEGEFVFTPWAPTAERARPSDVDLARVVYAVAGTDRLAPRLSRRAPATGVPKVVRLDGPAADAAPDANASAGSRR